jgi:hypothetical protein
MTIATREYPLRRLDAASKPRVFVDEHRRLIVEGKPFFPLGMYCFIREDKMQGGDIRLLAEAKFNCLMQYGMPSREQLDLAQRYHVKVIYALNTLFVGDQYCPASDAELRRIHETIANEMNLRMSK